MCKLNHWLEILPCSKCLFNDRLIIADSHTKPSLSHCHHCCCVVFALYWSTFSPFISVHQVSFRSFWNGSNSEKKPSPTFFVLQILAFLISLSLLYNILRRWKHQYFKVLSFHQFPVTACKQSNEVDLPCIGHQCGRNRWSAKMHYCCSGSGVETHRCRAHTKHRNYHGPQTESEKQMHILGQQ